MPEVVVRLLGKGGNGLRSASPSGRGLLRRGVDRNHGMVKDIAELVGLTCPPPNKVSRNSDTVEGGARPLCTASGFRHGKQGSADSPHPVVELGAQQPLLIIARSEHVKIEVRRERGESERGCEDFRPGVRGGDRRPRQ